MEHQPSSGRERILCSELQLKPSSGRDCVPSSELELKPSSEREPVRSSELELIPSSELKHISNFRKLLPPLINRVKYMGLTATDVFCNSC